ncbi:hypothetical protein ACHAPZ_002565 [Fusarium culmorum]
MDQPRTETPRTETPPAEALASPKPTIPELKATIDARVRAMEHLMGSLYAHLPCLEIDWALEGTAVCRVVGIGCYGLGIPG